jgi:hypothetical protein
MQSESSVEYRNGANSSQGGAATCAGVHFIVVVDSRTSILSVELESLAHNRCTFSRPPSRSPFVSFKPHDERTDAIQTRIPKITLARCPSYYETSLSIVMSLCSTWRVLIMLLPSSRIVMANQSTTSMSYGLVLNSRAMVFRSTPIKIHGIQWWSQYYLC